ncbi:hypothetical protein QI554_17525 [Yinghuangia seranimata]|nr:hypothetical protein [Yinghuangia seranimata]
MRAWLTAQADALHALEPGSDIPQFGTLEWEQAGETIRRVAALRFAAARYEDDVELRERLRLEVADMRAARLAYENDVVDEITAAVRPDRHDLARLPTLEVLQARRREYPEPRPMIQAPGWPAPIIPGSGGRRLGEPETGAA